MAYRKGDKIDAASFNNLVGPIDSTSNYESAADASGKMAAIWGKGYGTYGYGQDAVVLSAARVGEKIQTNDWFLLYEVVNRTSTFLGLNTTLPVSAVRGNILTAVSAVPETIQTIQPKRFLVSADSLVASSLLFEMQRNTNWGQGNIGGTSGLTGDVAIRWNASGDIGSGDMCRYFFNAGGRILIRLDHLPNSTPKNAAWRNILNNRVGDILITAQDVIQDASDPHGTITGLGYFDALDGYENILTGTNNMFDAPFTGNDVVISIKRFGLANSSGHGDNSAGIIVRVILQDEDVATTPDIVSNGTRMQVYALTPAAVVSNHITLPVITVGDRSFNDNPS